MIGLRSRREAAPALAVADWVPVQSSTDGEAAVRRSDHVVPATEHVLRSALVRFVVSSLLALVVVAAGTVFWSLHIAENEALRRAQATGIGVANGVIFFAPSVRTRARHEKRAPPPHTALWGSCGIDPSSSAWRSPAEGS